YVVAPGDSDAPGTRVSVIETVTNTVAASVDLGAGRGPAAVSVTPDGSRVYVANEFSNTVAVIDAATNTVTAAVPVGSGPRGAAVTPDGSRVYVANATDNTVTVID